MSKFCYGIYIKMTDRKGVKLKVKSNSYKVCCNNAHTIYSFYQPGCSSEPFFHNLWWNVLLDDPICIPLMISTISTTHICCPITQKCKTEAGEMAFVTPFHQWWWPIFALTFKRLSISMGENEDSWQKNKQRRGLELIICVPIL